MGGGKGGREEMNAENFMKMLPQGQNKNTLYALLAGATGLYLVTMASPGGSPPGQTREITFVDFCSQLVESGQVEKVVVANGTHAYVYMRSADGGSDGIDMTWSRGVELGTSIYHASGFWCNHTHAEPRTVGSHGV